jgi:hypothetical protein
MFALVKLGLERIQVSNMLNTSSMFQPGLSQSLAWQWVCADWVQPG